MGGKAFTSRLKTDIFLLSDTVIVLDHTTKKAQKLLLLLLHYRVFSLSLSLLSLHDQKPWKRYFKRIRSTKAAAAAVAGSSRGHVSAARTDPYTRDPPDSLHFLSQAPVSPPFGAFSQVLEGKKNAKAFRRRVSAYISISRFAVFISDSGLCICLLVSICNLFRFYFCTCFLPGIVHWDARSILEKNKDFYWVCI